MAALSSDPDNPNELSNCAKLFGTSLKPGEPNVAQAIVMGFKNKDNTDFAKIEFGRPQGRAVASVQTYKVNGLLVLLGHKRPAPLKIIARGG